MVETNKVQDQLASSPSVPLSAKLPDMHGAGPICDHGSTFDVQHGAWGGCTVEESLPGCVRLQPELDGRGPLQLYEPNRQVATRREVLKASIDDIVRSLLV